MKIIEFFRNPIVLYFLFQFVIGFLLIFSLILIEMRKERKELMGVEKIDDDVPYYRDIPFDNLEDAFYFGAYYGIIDNLSGYIGAVILKWIKEDKIDLVKTDRGIAIDFNKFFKTPDKWERKLYAKLLAASDSNKILEENEFKKIFTDEYKTRDFFKKMMWSIENKYYNLKLLNKVHIGSERKLVLEDSLKEKVLHLKGLKRYLIDFSIINERKPIEVHLWDEYLIYAELFGIADKVEQDFNNIYPDFNKMVMVSTGKMALVSALAVAISIPFSSLGGISHKE